MGNGVHCIRSGLRNTYKQAHTHTHTHFSNIAIFIAIPSKTHFSVIIHKFNLDYPQNANEMCRCDNKGGKKLILQSVNDNVFLQFSIYELMSLKMSFLAFVIYDQNGNSQTAIDSCCVTVVLMCVACSYMKTEFYRAYSISKRYA